MDNMCFCTAVGNSCGALVYPGRAFHPLSDRPLLAPTTIPECLLLPLFPPLIVITHLECAVGTVVSSTLHVEIY